MASLKEELVEQLLAFPPIHPYAKWTGAPWRLVEIADTEVPVATTRLGPAIEAELAWLLPGLQPRRVPRLDGRARRHASMEGERGLRADLPGLRRPSGHPATGRRAARLAVARRRLELRPPPRVPAVLLPRVGRHRPRSRALRRGHRNTEVRQAAERTAELLLTHHLFRSTTTGEPIHPSWTVLHYPAYWHYDVLQGLRLLAAVDRLGDPRAADALDVVERARRQDGRFSSRRWSSSRQPAAVDRGRGTENLMANELAASVLSAASDNNTSGGRQHG